MITLIHGENIQQSRDFYFKQKQNFSSHEILNGASITITDLAQAISGKALFDDQTSVFIEDLFSKKKKSKERDELISFLSKNQKDASIFLWESKSLTPSEIKGLGQIAEKRFDFPKEIFSFLDSIMPGNNTKAIENFHKTIKTEESEFVFFMIVRHFRILIGLNARENPIDEVKRLAPWQTKKLNSQKEKFSNDALLGFYNKLFELEKNLKTGKLVLPLNSSIDFLLSSL